MLIFVALSWATAPGISGIHPPTDKQTCLDCHADVTAGKTPHFAGWNEQCNACHNIPAAGGNATLTESPEKLCLVCHEAAKFTAAFVHGPVAVGACVTCHNPHATDNPSLLRETGKSLCFTCHEDVKAKWDNSRFQHAAIEAGCTVCHSPHSSPNRYQLLSAVPEVCAFCHGPVLELATQAAVRHEPMKDARSCLNCHNPHASVPSRLLLADGVAVCVDCHNKKVVAPDKKELTNMKVLLDENPDHHGPIREKYCAGCHQPHGSPNFRLLTYTYPAEFYAPFREESFALCFGCHDAAVARAERTTTLTDFRDGDRSLHFVHVNKTPKGRTCRACHETHASTHPRHIRNTVPFGAWELPVNYTKTERGGRCAPGCHAAKEYNRIPQQPQTAQK